jgi:soluble lytic murein transglycosylase-like protein
LRWIGWFGVAAGASLATPAALACWDEAARRYGVNSALLYAIAQTESSLNPRAIGHNRNGSRDIGLMQINSWWLPRLAVYGLQERHLFDPCTNIHIGAWILAGNLHRLRDPWEAVGAYHARDPQRRRAYVQRIQRRLAQTTSPHPTAASVSSSPSVTAFTAVASVTAPSRVAPPAAIAVFGSDSSTPRTPQELP